jgi:hypothetical protein
MAQFPIFASAIFVLGLCASQPIHSQETIPDSDAPRIELESPSDATPPMRFPQLPPSPPFDRKIADAIRKKCCGLVGPVRIQLGNGVLWDGKVARFHDLDSFDFRRRGSGTLERIYYRDVVAVNPIRPSFGEATLKGAEYTAMGAIFVVVFPFVLAMGVSCGFQCS